MCVALYKAIGLTLDEETLRKCFTSNPDGAGFAYIEDGQIHIKKAMTFKEFYEAYAPIQERLVYESPFLIHFRIKTHGQKDLANCHPFLIDDDHVFIHNGVIKNVPDCPKKERSDTRMFKELFLRQLPPGWFDNRPIQQLIEEYIGSFSKLAIMRRDGRVNLYNEKKGTWKDGVWFSNMLWDTKQYDDWWEKKNKNKYTHLDHCLKCGAYIKFNVYANKNNVSFCTTKCRDDWWSNKNDSYDNSKLCSQCSKKSIMTVSNDKGEFHYCSDACRDKHQESLTQKQKSKRERVRTFLDCCYCGNLTAASEAIELEITYGGKTEKECICYSCVPDAVKIGYIEETPELLTACAEIEAELRAQVQGV